MGVTNLYQSSVSAMPDAELELLSSELAEAYECNGEDDSYWTDDAAETRYYELTAEIRRRWNEANPQKAARQVALCDPMIRAALACLTEQLALGCKVSAAFDREFRPKAGDSISVRNPVRFTLQS